jgi:hypothetical protein
MTDFTAGVEVLAIGQRTEFSLLTSNERQLLVSNDAVAYSLLGNTNSAVQHARHQSKAEERATPSPARAGMAAGARRLSFTCCERRIAFRGHHKSPLCL